MVDNKLENNINSLYLKESILDKCTNLEKNNFNENEGYKIPSSEIPTNKKINFNIKSTINNFVVDEKNYLAEQLLKHGTEKLVKEKDFEEDPNILRKEINTDSIIFVSESVHSIWLKSYKCKRNNWSEYFNSDLTIFKSHIPIFDISSGFVKGIKDKLIVFSKDLVTWTYKPSLNNSRLHFKDSENNKNNLKFYTINKFEILDKLSEKIQFPVKVFTITE